MYDIFSILMHKDVVIFWMKIRHVLNELISADIVASFSGTGEVPTSTNHCCCWSLQYCDHCKNICLNTLEFIRF